MKKRLALSKSYLYLFLFSPVAAVASFSLVRIIENFGAHLEGMTAATVDQAGETRP